jgi:hypothetical protein
LLDGFSSECLDGLLRNLHLGTATALAQPAPNSLARFDQAGAIVANAAFVSDVSSPNYLRDQQAVVREPGYNIGGGAAELRNAQAGISDGSDPSYLENQQKVLREPGYSIGTGAARISGAW